MLFHDGDIDFVDIGVVPLLDFAPFVLDGVTEGVGEIALRREADAAAHGVQPDGVIVGGDDFAQCIAQDGAEGAGVADGGVVVEAGDFDGLHQLTVFGQDAAGILEAGVGNEIGFDVIIGDVAEGFKINGVR